MANGSFQVKYFCQVLVGGTNMYFSCKAIGCTHAPTKVPFFAWCVAKDKILEFSLVIDNFIWCRKFIGNR